MAQGSVDDPLPLSLAQIQADDSNNIVAGNRNTTLGVTGTLLGLSFLIVVLRCWARQVILRTFGIDDAAMLLALVSCSVVLPSATNSISCFLCNHVS